MNPKIKVLLVAIGIWLGASTAFGQDVATVKSEASTLKKNEISLSFGIAPFFWPENYDGSRNYGFAVMPQYMRQMTNWLDVGVIGGWYPAEDETDVFAMLAFRGNWVNKPSLKVYSELDLGGMWCTNCKWEGAVQYTLAGVNFGLGKNFFGQVELGLGSKGLLLAGVGYRF